MQKLARLGLLACLTLAAGTQVVACEPPPRNLSDNCTTNQECGSGRECSGGDCIQVTACSDTQPCPAGQSCLAQACRAACSSDMQCAAQGLRCDTAAGVCMPKPNGGSGGSANGGAAATAGASSAGSSPGGAASGGSGGTGTGTGGSSSSGGPTLELIDDLEDGDSRILEAGSRSGPWYVVSDGQSAPSATGLLTPEADGTGKAIHFTLNADSGSWGAGVQVDLNNPGSDALAAGRDGHNASQYTGFTFRAKGSGTVRVKANTSQIVSQQEHGDCTAGADCFNAYGSSITLSGGWQSYVVLFDASDTDNLPPGQVLTMAQEEGWGFQTAFDPSQLMGLTLQSAQAFELWIDDLAFFTKGTGSTGGTGGSGGGSGGSGSGSGGSATIGECRDDFWPAANNGSVTRYDFIQGTELPACSYVITHKGSGSDGDWDTVEGISTGDGGYFGAINTEDYAQGAACGACVELNYQGRQVVITVVDECPIGSNPLCTKGHIDLSRKAIRQLQPNGSLESFSGVSWRSVRCPAAGNVKMRLHPNANPDWNPVVIENGLFPLQSVTLNGANATRAGNQVGGNAWVAAGQQPPYNVRAVDVNGNAIVASFSGGSSLVDVGTQFMCQ